MRSLQILIRLISSVLTLISTLPAHPNHKLTQDSHCIYEDLEERLLTEAVVKKESFRSFLKKQGRKKARPTHPMSLITLQSGILGVFKEETDENYHYAEVAGYRASKILGLTLVPPTVFRTINGKKGSLQLYIDAPNLKKKDMRNAIFSALNAKTISDMKLFNYVFGRWDAHGGNELAAEVHGKYVLSLIDNSPLLHLTHQHYGQPAFISQGKNVPRPSEGRDIFPYDDSVRVKGPETAAVFKQYMHEKRVRKYRKSGSITYVNWHNRIYIRYTGHSASRFTNQIYLSTLQALKNLDHEKMYTVWREFHEVSPEHAEDLIHLTLERRDEIVSFFESCGTVIS